MPIYAKSSDWNFENVKYSRILNDSSYIDEDLVSKYFLCAKKTKNYTPAICLYDKMKNADFSAEIYEDYLKLLFSLI